MYLYSNIIGTFVFNQNFQIREKVLFKYSELFKIKEKFDSNEILDTEKKFLKKFKNIKNLRIDKDEKALEKINNILKQYKKEFHSSNLIITKKQVRDTITESSLIIQASNSILDLNKNINILVKRLREWYLYVLPELEDRIENHKQFAQLVSKPKNELMKKYKIKDTMGTDLKKEDMSVLLSLSSLILDLYKQKEKKEAYLEKLMQKTCPNLTKVAGYLVGAQLIARAGSLRNLVMMPASTIQLLGAEKALFRHMINKKAKPPKHGLILQHELLQKAKKANRGKVARALADKIGIAVKVDYFKGEFIGDKLKKDLEKRFK